MAQHTRLSLAAPSPIPALATDSCSASLRHLRHSMAAFALATTAPCIASMTLACGTAQRN